MIEVERKYLAKITDLQALQVAANQNMLVKQGYLVAANSFEWRVRRAHYLLPSTKPTSYTTAVKFGNGLARREYEREIPVWLFNVLWKLTGPRRLFKQRYDVKGWAVDVFFHTLYTLVLAELETDDWLHIPKVHLLEPKYFRIPGVKLLRDVTDSGQYANKRLATRQAI